jgi:hypothetical protein
MLKKACIKSFEACFNYWNILKEDNQSSNYIDNIKYYMPMQFKDKTQNDNESINDWKSKYYKDFNPTLVNQSYFSNILNLKYKIKLRPNLMTSIVKLVIGLTKKHIGMNKFVKFMIKRRLTMSTISF